MQKYFEQRLPAVNCRPNRGAAMVEAAIIIPLLLFVVAAIVSAGQIFYHQLLVSDALRLAGRAAVLAPGAALGGSGCTAAADAAFRSRLNRFQISGGADVLELHRRRVVGGVGVPDIFGVELRAIDLQVSCVLCPLIGLGGFEYNISASQFTPFESAIHHCWGELPDAV